MGNMYGGMYGSSDSGRSHKHHKHQHQHHHTAPQRQRQIQQSGSVFLASRRAVAQAQATTMTPGSANPTTPTIEQPVSATHGHHYPSAVATVGEQSSAHTGRAGGGLSADANQTAGSDKDLAEGTVGEQGEAQHSRPHLSLVERIMNFVRKTWMGLTATEDSELDELEGPTVHYKPEAIETLCQLTKFNRRELQLMYRGFKQECPSGMVKEDTFKMIYSQFFPRGADASQYAHFVFNTFDQDNTGAITFTDFVIGLSVLSRGSLQEKLRWTFNLYDINGDGYITKDELSRIVKAVYDLMGRAVEPLVEEHTTREHVERVFNRLDLNKDGVVTIDEFMDSCTKDENISKSMAVLDTIL